MNLYCICVNQGYKKTSKIYIVIQLLKGMRLEDIQFLLALHSVTPPRNAVILRQCPKSCAYAVGECLFNLLKDNQGLSAKEKKKVEKELSPYYQDLITLATNKSSLWNKKKSLYKLAGKPLKTILKTAVPTLKELEKIKRKEEVKEIKKREKHAHAVEDGEHEHSHEHSHEREEEGQVEEEEEDQELRDLINGVILNRRRPKSTTKQRGRGRGRQYQKKKVEQEKSGRGRRYQKKKVEEKKK